MTKAVTRMNFWMIYSLVRYKQGVTEKQAPVNVVLATSEQYLNQAALGRANQMAQVQALNSGLLPENSVTLGVVIGSLNFMGQMSDEEFSATLSDNQPPSEQITIGDEHGNTYDAAELLAREAGMSPVETEPTVADGSIAGSDGGNSTVAPAGDAGAGTDTVPVDETTAIATDSTAGAETDGVSGD